MVKGAAGVRCPVFRTDRWPGLFNALYRPCVRIVFYVKRFAE